MKTATSNLYQQDEVARSFFVPVKHEAGSCAEPGCSCGNAVIQKGSGYLHVSQKVVDYRKDCPTTKDLIYKLNKSQAEKGCFETVDLDRSAVFPRLLCKTAAIRHQLDLDTAAEDAANWWNSGKVPLRSTPTSF